ncbi:RING finger protein nhl-1-like [Ptychodera flava]|uniref:RING finger protein nhl-1-like n=1 Tax=Ptychodera flava TaxID=63121 RepID=UPI00396AB0A5
MRATAYVCTPRDWQWSKKTLDGNTLGPGQMFKDLRGVTFDEDQLVVCDKGNNIVQILSQDYTCETVLGSFSGQFAKPFNPRSVAISKGKLYFILDDNNLQIVVCKKTNEIVRTFSLPADTDPWCIALVGKFVLVAEVDGHRVLKYTQDGEYMAEIGSHGQGQTQFNNAFYMAVDSRDVIMVTDCNNYCIKCFDIDLKYLHQYGQYGEDEGQLRFTRGIAVDGDDNVYVCDVGNRRIVKWSSDGKWICNLFQRYVSQSWGIAVNATGDRIAIGLEQPGNEITIFSKKTDTSL